MVIELGQSAGDAVVFLAIMWFFSKIIDPVLIFVLIVIMGRWAVKCLKE